MMGEAAVIRYKVAIVGSGGVGKTTLLRRYATGTFRESRIMTIGVDFETIEVDLKGQPIKLTVWDLATSPISRIEERFPWLVPSGDDWPLKSTARIAQTWRDSTPKRLGRRYALKLHGLLPRTDRPGG